MIASLLKNIQREMRRFERVSGTSVPQRVLREIEKEINREGHMEKIMQRRFRAQAEYGQGSRRWKSLALSTQKQRARLGYGAARPILVRTGALFGAAQDAVKGTFSFSGVRWNVADVAVDYAAYHQSGGGRLPARRFMNNPSAKELEPTMVVARRKARAKIRELLRRG